MPSLRPCLPLAVLLLLGCSPKGDPGDTDGGSTTALSSSGASSSSSDTGGPSSSPTTGSGSGDGTTTSAPVTTSTTVEPGSTGSTSTTTVDPGDTTAAETGSPNESLCSPSIDGLPCETDANCEIAGDCCSCTAYNPDISSPGNCGGNCMQDKCTEWGLDSARCQDGVCVVKGKSCDQTKVVCDSPTPNCPMGELPQVEDGCFTGECLPLDACDWVPDCSFCGPTQVCNITQGPDCSHQRCVPNIEECQGSPLCRCLGAIFCAPPHESCADVDGNLVCSL